MVLFLLWPALVAVGIIKLNGFYYSNDICNTPVHAACNFREEPPFLTRTKEEIDRQCSSLGQHMECLKDYAAACGHDKVHFDPAKFYEAKHLVDDLCNKDSPLHSGIVQHTVCVSELMEDNEIMQRCSEYSRNKTGMLRQFSRNKPIAANSILTTYNSEDWASTNCVSEHLFDVCLASEASKKCGADAEKVVLEIANRKKSLHDNCESASEERINELIRALNLESENERILRAIIMKE